MILIKIPRSHIEARALKILIIWCNMVKLYIFRTSNMIIKNIGQRTEQINPFCWINNRQKNSPGFTSINMMLFETQPAFF